MPQFVINRRQIAIGGMKPLSAVKHFDIFKDRAGPEKLNSRLSEKPCYF
jgi:hypothetical protein